MPRPLLLPPPNIRATVSIRASSLAFCLVLLTTMVMPAFAQDQESGFKGFLHRAGNAVTQTASKVLGPGDANANAGAASGQAAGPATTVGPFYRPIRPASPGAIVGIFDQHRMGDAWPRVAVRFTDAGADRACWRAEATIWRSPTDHHVEVFDLCNAPTAFTDGMGRTQYLTSPEDAPGGGQGIVALNTAQNIQGMSHADTAPGDVRTTGPLPPHMLFYLGQGSESGPLAHQYREILMRLLWVTGWMNHANPTIDTHSGKVLWVIGINANDADAQEVRR